MFRKFRLCPSMLLNMNYAMLPFVLVIIIGWHLKKNTAMRFTAVSCSFSVDAAVLRGHCGVVQYPIPFSDVSVRKLPS